VIRTSGLRVHGGQCHPMPTAPIGCRSVVLSTYVATPCRTVPTRVVVVYRNRRSHTVPRPLRTEPTTWTQRTPTRRRTRAPGRRSIQPTRLEQSDRWLAAGLTLRLISQRNRARNILPTAATAIRRREFQRKAVSAAMDSGRLQIRTGGDVTGGADRADRGRVPGPARPTAVAPGRWARQLRTMAKLRCW